MKFSLFFFLSFLLDVTDINKMEIFANLLNILYITAVILRNKATTNMSCSLF